MLNWQDDFKKYVAGKLKIKLGQDVSPDQIDNISINISDDLSNVENDELAIIYAFAIMDENFERAKVIADEFLNRNCLVRIDNNNAEKSAVIIVYDKTNPEIPITDVKMKILPDGMIIDFEKQEF